jgi:hypothetical protein
LQAKATGIAMIIVYYAVSLLVVERLFVIVKPELLTLPWIVKPELLTLPWFAQLWEWCV